jgi:hypothetical protein
LKDFFFCACFFLQFGVYLKDKAPSHCFFMWRINHLFLL